MGAVEINGLVVDDQDGEIYALPEEVGMGDLARWIAYRLNESKQQSKLYEQEVAVLTATLLRLHGEAKKVVYDELSANTIQSSYSVQDTSAFVEDVKSLEPSREMLMALLEAAKGFDPVALAHFPELQAALAQYTEKRLKRPYIDIKPVKHPASIKSVERPTHSEDD